MKKFLILAMVLAVGLSYAENHAKYVIICADALYDSILPLAEWKEATGLSTRVVKLSQIGGNDTTKLKRFVRDSCYNSGPVQPEYVLLVGSPSQLSARMYRSYFGSYSSDNIYGDVTGNYQMEIPVGRFPASNTTQLGIMVAKTLMYEKTPDLTDSLWMRKLTTVVREGNDPDDTIYWDNVRRAAAQAAAAGFVHCDSLSWNRGNNSTSVMTSCNNGTGIVFYRGDAGGSWYTPFDSVKPGHLTSTNKLPIVCSFTCMTMTLDPTDPPMLGDSWMRAGTRSDLHGAAAYFGNTHPASNVARQRAAVCRGWFDGLFNEHIWKLGKTALRAKHELYVEFPTDTSDYRGFNLLGDPDLGIWTATPRILTVSHPADILPDSQQIHVTVHCSFNLAPVESALVCASMDTTVYVTGYTDSTGAIDLTVNPPDTGSLRLVVTGHNLYPYDAHIQVGASAVAQPVPARPAGAYGLTATPAVFTKTCRFTCNPALAVPAHLSLYDAQGRLVFSQPVRTSPFPLSTSSLPSGVYLAVLRDQSGRALGQTRITKLN